MATQSFEAKLGETTLTKDTVSVYAAYLDVSGGTIPESYQTLHIWYSTDSSFSTYTEKTFQASMATAMILQWNNYEITGLKADTTYYWIAYIGIPTVTTSATGSFTTEKAPVTETFEAKLGETTLTKNTASVYAAYLNTSGEIPESYKTLHIRYSKDSDFSTYTEKTFQPTTASSMILQWNGYELTGLKAGTTYYWIAYIGTPTVTTSDSGSFDTLSASGKAYICADGEFVPVTPYIYKGGWREATAFLNNGGWN